MPWYSIISLVDITRTNPSRDEVDKKMLAQQANFNSLIQAIGLRSNVEWEQDPIKHTGSLPLPFEGRGTYWTWDFYVERDEVFLEDDDPVGLLKQDLQTVPIIVNLDETIDITPAIFQTLGNQANIWVEIKA